MKKSKADLKKIQAFHDKKFEEYKVMSITELSEISLNKKMSDNERRALFNAATYIKISEHKARTDNESIFKEIKESTNEETNKTV